MRKLIIALILILVVATGAGIIVRTINSTPEPKTTNAVTKSTMTNFLVHSNKRLVSKDGNPIFTIKTITQPQKYWYIVSIVAKDVYSPTGKIIVNAPHGISSAYVIIGPQSSFSPAELSNYQIPDAVKKGILE